MLQSVKWAEIIQQLDSWIHWPRCDWLNKPISVNPRVHWWICFVAHFFLNGATKFPKTLNILVVIFQRSHQTNLFSLVTKVYGVLVHRSALTFTIEHPRNWKCTLSTPVTLSVTSFSQRHPRMFPAPLFLLLAIANYHQLETRRKILLHAWKGMFATEIKWKWFNDGRSCSAATKVALSSEIQTTYVRVTVLTHWGS